MSEEQPKKRKKHNARGKGHDAERKYAKIFRKAGWVDAKTMRYVSKMKDDGKLDLAFIPVNIQIKAGIQQGLSPSQVLKLMDEFIAKFPPHYPERDQINAVLHEKYVPSGFDKEGNPFKRTDYDSLVYMTFRDFFKLICMLYEKGKYLPGFKTLGLNDEGQLRETPDEIINQNETNETFGTLSITTNNDATDSSIPTEANSTSTSRENGTSSS